MGNWTNNDLSQIAPVLLKRSALFLREMSMFIRCAMFDVKDEIAQQNQVVNVTLPPSIEVKDVDINNPNTPTALVPRIVPVSMDYWKDASFSLSDRDLMQINQGLLPDSVQAAVVALATSIDQIGLLTLYKDIYSFAGTAGTTPGVLTDISNTMTRLNKNLAPAGNRFLFLDPDSHGKFCSLPDFANVNKSGSTQALQDASLGRKMLFDIFMDQNMPLHTKGTLASSDADNIGVKAIVAAGQKQIVLDRISGAGTLTGTLVKGDLFTLAGDSQQYVVTEGATASGNEITVKFEPGLSKATSDGQVFKLVDSHRVNLGFCGQAFCFASRRLEAPQGITGTIIEYVVDELSGVTLRLEIKRAYKQTVYSLDVLFGFKTIYPQLACRLLG